jgi:hypothetical protein
VGGTGLEPVTPSFVEPVRKLLTNRAYLGEAGYGDLVNPNAHEPIVTEKEWQAVQPGKRIVLPNEARRSPLCILRGVLVCGGCGRRMLVGGGSKKRQNVPPAPITTAAAATNRSSAPRERRPGTCGSIVTWRSG